MDAKTVFQLLTRPRRGAATADDVACLRSGTARRATVQGHGLAGWSWGDAGPRIMLVHGWESRASHLGHFVEPLRAAGFQVWAFDAPAHGDSPDSPASVVHHGKALLRIAQEHGPFDGVLAHSAGSPAALYAFRHGMRVASSVHVAGPASLERVVRRLARAGALDVEETGKLLAMMEAFIGQALASMELEALADGLRHPALLLHDPADPEVPYEETALLAQSWHGAKLVRMDGAGHRRIIRDPRTIAQTLAHFLETIPRARVTGPGRRRRSSGVS